MYQPIGSVVLKSGEKVDAGVVIAPDLKWADRLEPFLAHKGDPWTWQNAQLLRENHGIEAYFYILHRDSAPLSQIMTVELEGVGMLGHVWTVPEERGKGACAILMKMVMEDFRRRQGKVLTLGCHYGGVAHHIYESFGFSSVQEMNGHMTYYTASSDAFAREYYHVGPVEIAPINWRHWASLQLLFMSAYPGIVRCAPHRLIGLSAGEEAFLRMIRAQKDQFQTGKEALTSVLTSATSNAAVGVATWAWDAIWPDTCVVDIFCHSTFWTHGADLLGGLTLPDAKRYVAYVDDTCPVKSQVLADYGFIQTARLPGHVPLTAAKKAFADVLVMEKPGAA